MEEEFTQLCEENKIKEARRLFNNNLGTDNQIEIETIALLFLKSCMKCQIGITKMLFNIGLSTNQPLYIYVDLIDLFDIVILCRNFSIARWLYYTGKIYNIDYNIDKHKKGLLFNASKYCEQLDFLDSLY